MDKSKIASELLPSSAASQKILNSRAAQLSAPLEQEKNNDDEALFLQFKLNSGAMYGIPLGMMDEIISPERLTALTWLPPFIAGVRSWKSNTLTVLDCNYLCSEQVINDEPSERKIIVIRQGKKVVGLLVNEVNNLVTYKQSILRKNIQSPIKFNPDYFLGLLHESVILLNADEIINDQLLEIK